MAESGPRPAAKGAKLKRTVSFDESDTSAPAKTPAKLAPVKPGLTSTQMATNFGLVGISCSCAQLTVHWTQTTMVRQQLAAMATTAGSATAAADSAKLGFAAQARQIFNAEGLSGLHRGLSAAVLREMSYSTLRFGCYEPIKFALGATGPDSPAWKNVAAGLIAGTGAAAVASPTDLLTIRMIKHTGEPVGIGETARTILKEGGVRGLYRGIDTTMVRAAVLGGTKMGVYDTVKSRLRAAGWKDGPSLVFLASMLTGFAVTCTTSPATNARTMIMASPPGTYGGILGCMMDIVKHRGPLGLFRGFAAQWLRFGPYAVVQFTVWEQLRYLCGLRPI